MRARAIWTPRLGWALRRPSGLVEIERVYDPIPAGASAVGRDAAAISASDQIRIVIEGTWKQRTRINLGFTEIPGFWKTTPFRWVLVVRDESMKVDFRLTGNPVLVAVQAGRRADGHLHGQLIFNRFFPIKNLVFDPGRVSTLFDVEPSPGLTLTGEIRTER